MRRRNRTIRSAFSRGVSRGKGSRRLRAKRGAILITVMGIIVILSGMLLSFSRDMRSEAIASANRLAQLQADAIELGAEQWVMAQVDLYAGTDAVTTVNGSTIPDSWTLIFNTPAEAVQVGNGYFWCIRPDEESPSQFDYGLVDECSKFNLNALSNLATAKFSTTELLALPTSMTEDVADAVQDWMSTEAKASTDGAESDYYNGLQEPYDAKNQPYESVDEMLLVRGITPDILYGEDANRNGVLEDSEQAAAASSSNTIGSFGVGGVGVTSGDDTRGIYRYLTVWSTGETANSTGGAGGGGGGGGGAGGATTSTLGLINVNTASENVLVAMGLDQSTADSLISAAQNTTGGITDLPTLQQTLGSGNVPATFLAQTTMTSYQYSADIVAVSGDGRAFKRVRIVVDCSPASGSTTPTSPCKIVYRRDMTGFGWPLPADIRTQLRSGQPFTPGTPGSNLTAGN